MYLPKAHEVTDHQVLHDLIRAFPLGCIVTHGKEGLVANHVPFLIDAERGEFGTLRAHVARANPIWQDLASGAQSLVIFQGPNSYISPNWYPSKHQTGKAVPTWNYAVVHAHGTLQIHDERDWKLQLISELTHTHEAAQQLPWKVSDAPEEYIGQMLNAIVGLEMPIRRLIGKWKVSQNRPDPDRLGVAFGLQSKQSDAASASADLVLKALHG